MKRALAFLAAALVVAYGAYWIHASRRVSHAIAQPWPDDLGSLESVPNRFPLQSASEAAQQLVTLAEPLGVDLAPTTAKTIARRGDAARSVDAALRAYVVGEMARGERTIAEPPADVASFLAAQALTLAAIRQHLLTADGIVWPRDIQDRQSPQPNLAGHLLLTRVLVANALLRARNGDAGAWQDLHAAWNLSRTLHEHPELMTQIVVLAIARTINAAAWKLPVPAPAWRSQMDGVDSDRLLVRSLQYEKWVLRAQRPRTRFWPFASIEMADAIDREREIAQDISRRTQCDFDARKFAKTPSLAKMWHRAFRYRAEREATRNALLLAEGRPIDPRSRCSDGAWTTDGTWLRFGRAVAGEMPLALKVR